MQIWALIVDSFRESRDRKIFWVMLFITLVVAGAMSCVSFEPGKIDILFGTWPMETDLFTVGGTLRKDLIATIAVEWIFDVVIGWIGIILALIATAGFFPALLERGAIEVLLSKPLPRWKLFLGKYLGGMVFVAVHATLFVVLTFLIIGWRWRAWFPAYLLCIPLMVLLFSYLYCVSVLVAVVTKSTAAAVILSLGVWILFTGVQNFDDFAQVGGLVADWQPSPTIRRLAGTARWIVPKTQDITYKAKQWNRAATGVELVTDSSPESAHLLDMAERLEASRMAIPAVLSFGSSLLTEAIIVLFAMWRFARSDF